MIRRTKAATGVTVTFTLDDPQADAQQQDGSLLLL